MLVLLVFIVVVVVGIGVAVDAVVVVAVLVVEGCAQQQAPHVFSQADASFLAASWQCETFEMPRVLLHFFLL